MLLLQAHNIGSVLLQVLSSASVLPVRHFLCSDLYLHINRHFIHNSQQAHTTACMHGQMDGKVKNKTHALLTAWVEAKQVHKLTL